MKLKKLQQDRIEQIIQEELASLNEGWAAANAFKRSSVQNERQLFEGATELEQDLSEASISSALEQVSYDSALSCVVEFDNEVLKHVATVLKGHGLMSAGEDADAVYDRLADFDEGAMTDAQMECASDITLALDKYAAFIAQLVANSYSGIE